MGHTYSAIHLHIVFGTKKREPTIASDFRGRLHKYLTAISKQTAMKVWAVGGTSDHVHVLLSLRPSQSPSDFVRNLKAKSSKWVHDSIQGQSRFGWQDGFSVFSVSQSAIAEVQSYIETQEEHHRKRPFREELRLLLQKHGLEFDEKYL